MIYSIRGTIAARGGTFVVVEAGGIGYKVFTNQKGLKNLPNGKPVTFFTHLQSRDDGVDLYGFEDAKELGFFELLISVSGVGPRSALAVMQVADIKELAAAIKEGKPDVLSRASGIGKRTAERIILDLKGKVVTEKSGLVVKKMEMDADLLEALVGLGYGREEAREALGAVDEKITDLEARLKAALRALGGKKT